MMGSRLRNLVLSYRIARSVFVAYTVNARSVFVAYIEERDFL